MRIPLRVLVLSACVALPIVSYASKSEVVRGWTSTLDDTATLLRNGHYEVARKRLEKLAGEMLERIGPGEPADRLFAIVIGQLAVADAGSGREMDAIWTWHIAQNIHPAVRDVDLSTYGNAGQFLGANLLGPSPEKCSKHPADAPPPVITKRVEPMYPEGARQFRESGIVIVQIRLDAEGRPIEPYVLKPLAAPVTYAALDALHRWRFEPSKADDPLKDVPFCVTFNFKLR
jgi:protein TonB